MHLRSTTSKNCLRTTRLKISASSGLACRSPGWAGATGCLSLSCSGMPVRCFTRSTTRFSKDCCSSARAISICGLPPFNGFVSEFLIYKSFFRAGDLLRGYAPLVLLFSAVGLAFMGGLAVACFTKLYGIVFLGVNRSGAAPSRQREPLLSSVALLGLASLCTVIGIFPQTGLRLIAPALGELASTAQAPVGWASPLG